MERAWSAGHTFQKRKQNRIIDLDIKRSIGAISSTEYKRRIIMNELNHLAYRDDVTSLPQRIPHESRVINDDEYYFNLQDNIVGMEADPREGRCLLVLFKYSSVAIFDVSKHDNTFEKLKHMGSPIFGTPNAAHWLWDGTIFSVGTIDSVHFWDSSSCRVVETIKLRTSTLNHVIAAKKYSAKKYVAVTGVEGHVFMIDLLHGIVVMTMRNVEKSPIRAIHWHPLHENQYVTGNNKGNIYLWDIRFQNKFVFKFTSGDPFTKATSCSGPIAGLRFYNNGNGVISIDEQGTIKSWEASTGRLLPNHYAPISMCQETLRNSDKDYQFAVTEYLKEDVAFFPTSRGMTMLDIESGELLPYSNDIKIPITCATYDSKRYCVYGATDDIVKLWDTEKKPNA